MADGKIVEIEASEAIARVLADFKREDENYRRKMRRHNLISLDALRDETEFEPVDPNVNIEESLIAKEERSELTAALKTLDKKNRELIQTIYFNEIPVQEYAEKKGVSFQSVYKRLLKIYDKIKNILAKEVE